MTPTTMNEAFGQLRALLQAPQLADRKELRVLLEAARALDPDRYDEVWIPYLADHDLPTFRATSPTALALLATLLPPEQPVRLAMQARADVISRFVGMQELSTVVSMDVEGVVYDTYAHHPDTRAALAELLGRADLSRLESLTACETAFGDAGLSALTANETLTSLKCLDLEFCGISYLGARRLALCERMHTLVSLDLSHNGIEYTGLTALAQSPYLSGLKTLFLEACSLIGPGVESLARSPYVTGLELLSLDDNDDLSASSLHALLRSPVLAGVTDLRLGRLLSDEVREIIEASPHLTRLEVLR